MTTLLLKPTHFVEVRNSLVYQQMVLLSIINTKYSLTLHLPNKKAVVYEQLVAINNLSNKSESVDVEEVIKQRCHYRLSSEKTNGVSEKTLHRRRQNYSIIERMNFLVDTVREMGYFVECEQNGGKRGILKGEVVKKIYCEGRLLFDEADIEEFGKKICEYVSSLSLTYGSLKIEEKDKNIQSIYYCGM
ncbi:hypothetical protein EIN_059720 [Entamoeba invadens IP1]|uniref:hypothetical protein n=1 Tax=Entamoeba invadens IP1 TaxID=370355 RepID=UPI0002C3FB38|nr:hypothetical protein EIN_059720 [Entamoeba invadens IP1]ELP93477.1 hypothetical protein EIN_059720 [Entamoeba invadens IP1]|eukprot:XP_004260248.1 hypothetical protein EIN_059720 [Entamoeba invadens IP1]